MSSLSYVTYTGDGSNKVFTFPFPYMQSTDVFVFVNGTAVPYTFINGSSVSCAVAPFAGSSVQIRRITQKIAVPVNFTDGSVLLESDLDTLATYTLYVAQEGSELDTRITNMENTIFGLGGGIPGTVYNQTFSGDGATTAFQLTATPSTSANVEIHISGAYQNHDTFTVSGKTLSFSEAPPAGSTVEVQISVARDLGKVAAGSALFTPTAELPQSDVQAALAGVGVSLRDVKVGLRVTPQMFDAVGDNIVDDTAALNAMFATGKPWHIPYTEAGYKFSSTLTINADGDCDAYLWAVAGFNGLCVDIGDPGYPGKRRITGLYVRPTTARVPNSVGVRMTFPNVVLDRCTFPLFDYGIQVWSFSIMLLNCNAYLCNTNLSAYARNTLGEINDLKVIGGNYDSATQYSCRIGDPRFTSTKSPGDPHGVSITLLGANFDGAVSTFDRVFSLNIQGCYWEGPASGNAIELGGAGDNWLKNVTIGGCYFSTVKYAIKTQNAIAGLLVNPNYYAGVITALHGSNCDVAGFEYRAGVSVSGFTGPEVHTGFTSGGSVTALIFSDVSISGDYLTKGAQVAPTRTSSSSWYPNGMTLDGYTHVSSAYGRFRTTPATAIAGTMAGSTFTCTNPLDSLKFNGGDRVIGANGASFVRSVDYVGGVVTVNATGTGAYTLSHEAAPTFLGTNLSGFNPPEGGVVGSMGSTYRCISNGKLYQKESGTGNTGWIAK